MVVRRTYRTGKLVWKFLVVVVFNNLNMFESRRIRAGCDYEGNVEHSPFASGRTLLRAHTDEGIGSSPTRLDSCA